MIGHKKYLTGSGMPSPLSRKCILSSNVPAPMSAEVVPESFLVECNERGVKSVSLYCDDTNGNHFGDYVVSIGGELYENVVSVLCEYWALLVEKYAVDKTQIELFESEGRLFLQVDGRAFSYERGYKQLGLVYEAMNRELVQSLFLIPVR